MLICYMMDIVCYKDDIDCCFILKIGKLYGFPQM